MELVFHREARREVEDTVSYYDDRALGLGEEFLKEVSAATDLLRTNAALGVSVRPQIRRYVLRRFPYSLLYHPTDKRILILAVMHHKRRPGYWEDRT